MLPLVTVVVLFQDFSVTFGHCPEITVYTSCCYFPSAGQLPGLWAEHRRSLLRMLVEVSDDLRGQILAGSEGGGMGGLFSSGLSSPCSILS